MASVHNVAIATGRTEGCSLGAPGDGVHRLVAGLNRLEHRLPLPLDRRAVWVQLDLEAGSVSTFSQAAM